MIEKVFKGVKNSKTSYKSRKRILLIFFFVVLIFAALAVRLGWHMIIKGDEYAVKASKQQTIDKVVTAVRGDILDAYGNQLAISATTHTIWVRPATVKSNGKTEAEIEDNIREEARQLAELLGQDEESVYETITSDKVLLRVAKFVDQDTTDAVRKANLPGIEIVQDVRRYYPLGAFACQILGLTNDDGDGMTGLELFYERYLSGINGRWITSKDNKKNPLVYADSKYYNAQDGYTIVTTIDQGIQQIVEEKVAKYCEMKNADRVSCIVMDPNTGEILAMAQSDEFDPNNPRDPQPGDEEVFFEMSDEEKVAYWNRRWRSFCMSDTYEPGSTFKLITTAIALDAGVTSLDDTFECSGYINIYDRVIHCWNYPRRHGSETLADAIFNSCNVSMVYLADRMGRSTFYKGLQNFGLTEKTGVDFPGEASNQIYSYNDMNPVEMATMGFGQGISLTPVSLCTAVSAIVNGGYLLQPRLVKEIRDADGNTVETIGRIVKNIAISQETSADMRYIMQYVVDKGGSYYQIPGYVIGGKTGTAQKPIAGGYSAHDVYASYIGVAPINDPKYVVLVLADTPRAADNHGSYVAAPCASEIMEEVLRYKNIEPEYTEEDIENLTSKMVTVPDLTGTSFETLPGKTGRYLEYSLSPALPEDELTEIVVIDQYPKPGTKIEKGSTIIVYYEIVGVEDDIVETD